MKPGERWYLNLDLVHEATNMGAEGLEPPTLSPAGDLRSATPRP